MLLSVVVYKHKLTLGQWVGAAIVFAGISVEAFVKRKGEPPINSNLYTIESNALSTRCPRQKGGTREGEGKD